MKQVVISVVGGVAYLQYKSKGVEVAIVDLDNIESEEERRIELEFWLKEAKKDEKKGRK